MVFGHSNSGHSAFGHICGCYFLVERQRTYLPQVSLKSHTTLNPVCFTTHLTQTFNNPNPKRLAQVRYTFPLYDGVAVNSYTITFGEKTLHGIVKHKDDAKKTYQAAVDRGNTAGLLESLPAGVFGVTLGNVPAQTDITVQITYCGELKHDASMDGLRYILPTAIAPRYGAYPGNVLQANTHNKGGISITVDVDMAKSPIRRVQSPSHPIAVSMGGLSTAGDAAAFSPSQASATLTQGSAELAGDFILQLLIDDISRPQAILESHETFPHQRAIMATLVPKFVLDSAHPEIVFIADQSGSMSGSKNRALVAALKVFLKSLPLGVRFNICAFGNSFRFLWPTSQAYSEDNVNMAISFVDSFSASYGGTEILKPIQAAFERHLKDMPLEVMLLTEGEIWAEQSVFSFINEQIQDKGVDARVFALGIGQDVSHTLVEGVARAGNGFAQFVTQNEDTDLKVIRMLKGALFAHTRDYSIEVNYSSDNSSADDDDFEIVEKVNDCLIIQEDPKQSSTTLKTKVLSFFDTSVNVDAPQGNKHEVDRWAHLPAIDTPKVLQAPTAIPPLFPFNRTTVYLLLGPDSAQKNISSVTLRAEGPHGPLELTIPIQANQSGTSIHQLAARKAIQDLEEGRGWLQHATVKKKGKTEKILAKKQYESRFDEIVQREIVRLGEKFQIASKFTSFVAVEDGSEETKEADEGGREAIVKEAVEWRGAGNATNLASKTRKRSGPAVATRSAGTLFGTPAPFAPPSQAPSRSGFGSSEPTAFATGGGALFGNQAQQVNTGGGLFGQSVQHPLPAGSGFAAFGNPQAAAGGLFGQSRPMPQAGSLFGSAAPQKPAAGTSLFGGSTFGGATQASSGNLFGNNQQSTHQTGLFGASEGPRVGGSMQSNAAPADGSLFNTLQQPTQRSSLFANANTSLGGHPFGVAEPKARSSSLVHDADENTGGYSSTLRMRRASPAAAALPAPSRDRMSFESYEEEDEDEDMGFGLFGDEHAPVVPQMSSGGAASFSMRYGQEIQDAMCMPLPDGDDPDLGRAKPPQAATSNVLPADPRATSHFTDTSRTMRPAGPANPTDSTSTLHKIIGLQTFSGAWDWTAELLEAVGGGGKVEQGEISTDASVAGTAVAIAYLQQVFAAKKDVWEMVVSKGLAWLAQQCNGEQAKVEQLIAKAKAQL